MNIVHPDPVSLTTNQLFMYFDNQFLSSGTGFIYLDKEENIYYLITNWHNVTGKNPLTGECLHTHAAIPNKIVTQFRQPIFIEQESVFVLNTEELILYKANNEPIWYEHPEHGKLVDVVAIPLSKDICERYKLSPINELDFQPKFKEAVADDVFVIGYPFQKAELMLPIWKKASIATEPAIPIDNLPKMLIDTATRPGLSGAPVIMKRSGVHGIGEQIIGSMIVGVIRNFIGVYSGRIGEGEDKVQLGIVWRAHVIEEIINGKLTNTFSL